MTDDPLRRRSTMLFNEVPFLERFRRAAAAGSVRWSSCSSTVDAGAVDGAGAARLELISSIPRRGFRGR
jgi:hypothetical protein